MKMLENMSRTAHKIGFVTKKHSPEILVAAGLIGAVASTVLACKATPKAMAVMEDTSAQMDAVRDCTETGVDPNGEEYTTEDAKHDKVIIATHAAMGMVKTYGPSVCLGVTSAVCILSAHNIMRKRNVALAAAYSVVDKGFKQYRSNVVERFGKEMDYQLKHNIKAKTVKEMVVDDDGNEVEVETVKNIVDINELSTYARWFDETSEYYEKDSDYNMMFLKSEQNFANDKLRANGHLFLNEVYERLGMPKTRAGQVVGWLYDPNNIHGDNYVDFGLYDADRESSRDFVNGYERRVLLDFNVDGDILGSMPK